jgi:hypothetical protein
VHVVVEVQSTVLAAVDPNLKVASVAPTAKPAPLTVMTVPPALGPALGLRLVTVGGPILKRSCEEIGLGPFGEVTTTFTLPAQMLVAAPRKLVDQV